MTPDGFLRDILAAPGRLEYRPEVRHDLLRLLGDTRPGKLAGLEADSELAGVPAITAS